MKSRRMSNGPNLAWSAVNWPRPGKYGRSNDKLVGTKLYGRPTETVRKKGAHHREDFRKKPAGNAGGIARCGNGRGKGNIYVPNATGEKRSRRDNNGDARRTRFPQSITEAVDRTEDSSSGQQSGKNCRTGCSARSGQNTMPTNEPIHRLISLNKFLENMGVTSTTGWRWRKKGMIPTVNIYGRLYVSEDTIAEFHRRATAGEFAKDISPRKAE